MEDATELRLGVDEDSALLVLQTRRGDDDKQRKTRKRMEAAAWCLMWWNGDEERTDSVDNGGSGELAQLASLHRKIREKAQGVRLDVVRLKEEGWGCRGPSCHWNSSMHGDDSCGSGVQYRTAWGHNL